MKVYRKDNKIIFEFLSEQQRYNPYMDDSEQILLGTYPTFTGLIVKEDGYDDIGFAGTIDMDYKGKPDQVSDFIVKWNGGEEQFMKLCKELSIDIQIMDHRNGNK